MVTDDFEMSLSSSSDLGALCKAIELQRDTFPYSAAGGVDFSQHHINHEHHDHHHHHQHHPYGYESSLPASSGSCSPLYQQQQQTNTMLNYFPASNNSNGKAFLESSGSNSALSSACPSFMDLTMLDGSNNNFQYSSSENLNGGNNAVSSSMPSPQLEKAGLEGLFAILQAGDPMEVDQSSQLTGSIQSKKSNSASTSNLKKKRTSNSAGSCKSNSNGGGVRSYNWNGSNVNPLLQVNTQIYGYIKAAAAFNASSNQAINNSSNSNTNLNASSLGGDEKCFENFASLATPNVTLHFKSIVEAVSEHFTKALGRPWKVSYIENYSESATKDNPLGLINTSTSSSNFSSSTITNNLNASCLSPIFSSPRGDCTDEKSKENKMDMEMDPPALPAVSTSMSLSSSAESVVAGSQKIPPKKPGNNNHFQSNNQNQSSHHFPSLPCLPPISSNSSGVEGKLVARNSNNNMMPLHHHSNNNNGLWTPSSSNHLVNSYSTSSNSNSPMLSRNNRFHLAKLVKQPSTNNNNTANSSAINFNLISANPNASSKKIIPIVSSRNNPSSILSNCTKHFINNSNNGNAAGSSNSPLNSPSTLINSSSLNPLLLNSSGTSSFPALYYKDLFVAPAVCKSNSSSSSNVTTSTPLSSITTLKPSFMFKGQGSSSSVSGNSSSPNTMIMKKTLSAPMTAAASETNQ